MKASENKYIKTVSIALLTTMVLGLFGMIWEFSIESVEARVERVAKKVNQKSIERMEKKVMELDIKTIKRLDKVDKKLDKILFYLIDDV